MPCLGICGESAELSKTNSNTAHSKDLRAKSAKTTQEKILREGGIRFSVLLEQPYASQFEALAEKMGSKKKALLFLLDQYQQ